MLEVISSPWIEDWFESFRRILFYVYVFLLQQVNRLEITPDKRFLAAAGNPHIRLFDVNSTSPQPVCFMSFLDKSTSFNCSLSLSPLPPLKSFFFNSWLD